MYTNGSQTPYYGYTHQYAHASGSAAARVATPAPPKVATTSKKGTALPTWGTVPSPTAATKASYLPPPARLTSNDPIELAFSPLDLNPGLEPVTLSVVPTIDEANPTATILRASFLRADGKPRFVVQTDAERVQTAIEDGRHAQIATINWNREAEGFGYATQAAPTLLVNEVGWSMRTSEWLYLSSDRTCRTMIANGRQYSWRPNGSSIELFPLEAGSETALPGANVLARISMGITGPMVQLAPRALHLKLLNFVVVSVVLLMSGRNID